MIGLSASLPEQDSWEEHKLDDLQFTQYDSKIEGKLTEANATLVEDE